MKLQLCPLPGLPAAPAGCRPGSNPDIAATWPRVYAQHRELGTIYELHRGLNVGAMGAALKEARAMSDCWIVWPEYRQRRDA